MNATVAIPVEDRAVRAAYGPLLLISFAMLVGFTMMQSFGIMAEAAKAELHLSDSAIAMVQGLSAALPLAVFSIPIGLWVDRANRTRILWVMALGWTLGTVVTAVSSTVPILFFGRLLTAIGTTGSLTAVLSLAADYCPPEQRGRAIIIPNLSKTAGIALGFTLTGFLMTQVAGGQLPRLFGSTEWRSSQWLLALLSLACLVPLLFLREPPRRETEAGPSAPFKVVWRELVARKAWLLPLFVGQTSVIMADAAAGIWIAPVLHRNFGLAPGDFAGWLGMVVLLTGIAGSILGGFVADLGQRSHRRGGLLYASLLAVLVSIPLALYPLAGSVPMFAGLVAALLLAGGVTSMGTSVALTVWLPNELRGLAIGAFIAFAGLIGFGLAPSAVAWVSTPLGGESQLALALALVGAGVSVLSVIGFGLAIRRAPDPLTSQTGLDEAIG
ncbi:MULTISPECIES: MFS transporter [Sphingomonas]|uniref:MFS transporter n=1 Tax=Sphingomonas TaxID=13687 RepID=UPI000DEF0C27|nr:MULTISPECIES: MFS transporter [Sphingomonas]